MLLVLSPLNLLSSFALTVLTFPHIYKADQADNTCTVIPLGHGRDDVPNILAAVDECGRIPGGRILLPEPYTYRINQRLTAHVEHSTLDIHGTLLYSDDITYWVNNSYRVDFQKQASAWRITGHDYEVNGGPSMGGIDGNGQLWYTWAKGGSNVFGRPIPMHIYNSTRAVFRNVGIRQPQFWAVLVDESSHVLLENFYFNATNTDFYAKDDTVWIQNTDGVDTFRSDHVVIKDWVYESGDDAVAFKGNSTNVVVQNMTVYGGPGIAFGSLGQYPERVDIVENITVRDVVLQPSFQRAIKSGIYIKSWWVSLVHSKRQKMRNRIGVNFGNPPNGGGAGHDYLRNVTVEKIQFKDVQMPVYFDTCYLVDQNITQYCDTSTYRFDDIYFKNIKGNGLATPTDYPGENVTFAISVLCSEKAKCRNITFQDVDISLPDQYEGKPVLCKNAEFHGLECDK